MRAGLALLFVLGLAQTAGAEMLSPATTAADLPLPLPQGFVMPLPEGAPPPVCMVTKDELPDNFLMLLDRLGTPVTASPTGLAPEIADLPQNHPAQAEPATPSEPGRISRSREHGVTVFRGPSGR